MVGETFDRKASTLSFSSVLISRAALEAESFRYWSEISVRELSTAAEDDIRATVLFAADDTACEPAVKVAVRLSIACEVRDTDVSYSKPSGC